MGYGVTVVQIRLLAAHLDLVMASQGGSMMRSGSPSSAHEPNLRFRWEEL